MMPDLSELFAAAEPYLVGVWRYHERGGPSQWCCSVHIEDDLFDLPPSKTMREALQRVVDAVAEVAAPLPDGVDTVVDGDGTVHGAPVPDLRDIRQG